MENKPTNVEELFYKLKEYVDIRLDLFRLKSVNKISGILSTLMVVLILVILLFLVMICLTIGIALLIGAWLGKAYYGFFIIGGIYIIIGLVLYYGRDKYLKKPVSDKLIKELLD